MEFMFASARKHDDKNEEQKKKMLQVLKVENLIEKTMCSTMPAHFSIVYSSLHLFFLLLPPFEQEIIIVRRVDHSCNLECSLLPNNVPRRMTMFIIISCARNFSSILFLCLFTIPLPRLLAIRIGPSKFHRFDRTRECIQ